MLPKIFRIFWGDLTTDELKKFGILSAILSLIICNYSTLRILKDSLLHFLVGYQWQPLVKLFSILFTVFVVMIYGKLVDLFEKQTLFYIICPFYGFLFIILSYFAAYPDLIAIESNSCFFPFVCWVPGRLLGWFLYVSAESSSILVALFWAFVASTTKVESAKKGYGMIFFFTQIGMIAGPFFVVEYVQQVGSAVFLGIGGFLILLIPFLVKLYMTILPKEDLISNVSDSFFKAKTSFLEGLKLLLTRPYVMGIFVIATFYEVVGTILEFQMNMIASSNMTIDAFAAFKGKFLVGVGFLALIFALLGTSFFMRKFGLRFCLIIFPTVVGLLVCYVFISRFFGLVDYQMMWIIFSAMIAIRGLNYALNNPTKEVMYIPTSKDIKFKAKSWIDVFGNRSTKGIGAGINTLFRTSLPDLLFYGTVISFGIVGVWIIIANFVGKTFNNLQKDNKFIE